MNSMHIYCPFCGTPYDIDASALPHNDVKTKCRVCSNVFVLNKNTGAAKEEPVLGEKSGRGNAAAEGDDAAQSATAEINAAVAKDEAVAAKNNREKRKINSLQIITFLILIILFLIAVIEALMHFHIIDLSFLLKNLS
ncbi:zinc-ribbon domain-containing protein [Candidatus Acidulodesulfobacterium sp. H_13]|uniref:zinc-ribbon domain-containing protein n=1 Tax=Candidatus Acidulodesulfobacterium sp. H_13 TaxID=3395470 RepID=UPI003AF7C255